jgi:hypothetical protein
MMERTNNTLTANVCKFNISRFNKHTKKSEYSIINQYLTIKQNPVDNSIKHMYFRSLEMIEI